MKKADAYTIAHDLEAESVNHALAKLAADELVRLANIEAAARNLVKVKGRYHTEQAFKALAALLVNPQTISTSEAS